MAEHRVKRLAILKMQRIILTVFTLVTFFLNLFRLKSGDARGQDIGRLIFVVHPSTPEETIEIRCHRHTSTTKEASKRENAKEGFGPELQESVGSVLMVENPLYSPRRRYCAPR